MIAKSALRRPVSAGRLVVYVLCLAFMMFTLFPVVWMLSTSFKDFSEAFALPPHWIPSHPTVSPYVEAWVGGFSRNLENSVIVSVSTTLIASVLALLAGYGFSRFRFRGRSWLMRFILVCQMFPAALLIVPYYMLMGSLGLVNTYPSLIIAFTSFALPFCVYMLRGYFDSVPRELDEAALVDGCDRLTALVRVIVPVATPGIAATMIFTWLLAWNHYLFALVLATDASMYTVPVGIAAQITEWNIPWSRLMAAAVMASVPTIALYAGLQRYLVQGLSAGSVKG